MGGRSRGNGQWKELRPSAGTQLSLASEENAQKQFLHYPPQRKSRTIKAIVLQCTARGATSSLPERSAQNTDYR